LLEYFDIDLLIKGVDFRLFQYATGPALLPMQQNLLTLLRMRFPEPPVYPRQRMPRHADNNKNRGSAGQQSIHEHAHKRAYEHQRQNHKSVLISNHGLVVESCPHLVGHVAER